MGKRFRLALACVNILSLLLIIGGASQVVHEAIHGIQIAQNDAVDFEEFGYNSFCYINEESVYTNPLMLCLNVTASETATPHQKAKWLSEYDSREMFCDGIEMLFLLIFTPLIFYWYFNYLKKHRNLKAFKPGE